MIVQKLPWAGAPVVSGSTAIAVDPLYHFPEDFGRPREPLPPLSAFGSADAVFVTHHHYDHFDPRAVAEFYGADVPVYHRMYGPFDAVLLPVNGAVVELPGMAPSGQPITLTPEQAVAAAKVLNAARLVPIHWRTVHHPPAYRETPDIVRRLAAAAAEAEGVRLAILGSGETVEL